MTKMTGLYDLDSVRWAASSAGEKREVRVVHKSSGREIVVPTRTSFYGHWKNKDGGMLAEINRGRTSPFIADDFDYFDVQTPAPIENVLHTVKMMVEANVRASEADDVKFYIGRGESFRVGLSTLWKYKGNRDNQIRPVLMEDVVEYMIKKYSPEIITEYEVDDVITMDSYGKDDTFMLALDKDMYGTGSLFFNFNIPDEGVVDTSGLGSLWLDAKGNVRGTGRMFKLFQTCSGDDSDNYKANCISDIKWGDKSAYNALKDSKNDRELFINAISVFKHLYPVPFQYEGWRGDLIDVDWKYVFQECFTLAHMHRWEDDYVLLDDVFDRLKINPDDVAPYGEE